MDLIQKGIAELERQRKVSAFNCSVFLSALRENSEYFQTVRKQDYGRVTSLTRVLCAALAEQTDESRSAAYWSERAEAHAASLAVHSKFYAAIMSLLGLGAAYFFGDNSWGLTIIVGLLLAVFMKVKWGLDKYCAGLELIRNTLNRISDAPDSEMIMRDDVDYSTTD